MPLVSLFRPLLSAGLLLVACGWAAPASAELDLRRAGVSRLDNGLTVIVLEDHSRPIVSTQVIYRSGSRDETAGKTGLAHFLEHLAFRGSANFPQAAATEAIYDAGGEWHGYTWLDQTSYYSTMPADGLELLLRIEADRMARVTIDPAAIEAERGAVLTEMHGYENDPASVLFDAAAAAALQAHPYRNNTIGYESDVAGLTAEDALAFYRRHYAPANAVLAIVGDVAPERALRLVRQHFGSLAAREPVRRTRAVEPPQRGERRITIAGPVRRQYLKLAYPAPAASSPDFAAFLVLQQLLSGGSGVNFRQNDWGPPAVAGSALAGVAEDLTSWFIATADPYLFIVSASLDAGADQAALERELERRIARVRDAPPSPQALQAARRAVAEQLVFDVETTEDAAHQLAFFEGLGAYDVLVRLPQLVAAVGADDVQRVARAYLAPQLRTLAWYVPGAPAGARPGAGEPRPAAARAPAAPAAGPAGPPQLRRLTGGLAAIVQNNPLSPTATVTLLLTAPVAGEALPPALPGLGEISRSGAAADLPRLIASARSPLAAARPVPAAAPSPDPEARLEQMIMEEIGAAPGRAPAPVVAVVSGAVEPAAALAALEQGLGDVQPGSLAAALAPPSRNGLSTHSAAIDLPLAQGALGYVAPAPPPGSREGFAWRMLLYILTHDYSGRLGRLAIAERGLVYHIYSAYRTDGARGWVTISTGVDAARIDAMEAALRDELARLASEPPSAAEVAAARQHLLGRDLSAAQSNAEVAARLAREFVETGGLPTHEELAAMLESIGPADVAAAAAGFGRGTILRVDVGRR
jgi:predicted Zn-dependent peptidase